MEKEDHEVLKYLGALQLYKTRNKENIVNEYIRRVKLICKSNLNSGSFISALIDWAVGVMRYSGGIIIGTKEELHDMNRQTRKIMTFNRHLHQRNSVAKLYMKQKEGARRLISVEVCITTERRGLYDYLEERKEDILSEALKENITEEGETNEECTKRERHERKNILHEGKLKGQFVENTGNIAHEFSRKWKRNGCFKEETKACYLSQFLSNVDCIGQNMRPLCI